MVDVSCQKATIGCVSLGKRTLGAHHQDRETHFGAGVANITFVSVLPASH